MKDFVGRTIRMNDKIAYFCSNTKNSITKSKYIVKGFTGNRIVVYDHQGFGRKKHYIKPGNCVVYREEFAEPIRKYYLVEDSGVILPELFETLEEARAFRFNLAKKKNPITKWVPLTMKIIPVGLFGIKEEKDGTDQDDGVDTDNEPC